MSHPAILAPAHAYALWASSYPAHAHNPVMQAEERAMLQLMPDSLENYAVLDAGCGSGRYIVHALQRGAVRVSGVDLSPEMLQRAELELSIYRAGAEIELMQGSLTALPVSDASADLTICGLVVGHLENLEQPLAELHRVTRPGGTVLCSDVHPIGHALGWVRDFKSGGQRYAVQHTTHTLDGWRQACHKVGLLLQSIWESSLDPADIPPDAHFDPAGLSLPVVLTLSLMR